MRVEVTVGELALKNGWRFRTVNDRCPVALAVYPLLKRHWSVGGEGELYNHEDSIEFPIIEGFEAYEAMIAAHDCEEISPFTLVYEIPEEELTCSTN